MLVLTVLFFIDFYFPDGKYFIKERLNINYIILIIYILGIRV